MPAPQLTRRDVDGEPRGLVLMLHGGRADGHTPIDDRSASWRRSRWMMSHVEGRLTRAGVSVWLLRYQVRGWNAGVASTPSPVPDARWALDEVRRELTALDRNEHFVGLHRNSLGGCCAIGKSIRCAICRCL